ncbi:MAG TPA: nucleoside monophosphate kinase, partial [Candidatus Saccharimonas sp.]|nr:nucleoside monophosphate kinase [Candidatus Saccharimonas sp.]
LSAGQLLRDTHNPELLKEMSTGKLVDNDTANKVMLDALNRSKNIDHVIVDGFPRELSQAKWLLDAEPEHERSIKKVVVLEVPKEELIRRLTVRGRADDTAEAIEERLHIYRTKIYPILAYFNERHISIAHIDGTGTVGQVHDRIVAELSECLPK